MIIIVICFTKWIVKEYLEFAPTCDTLKDYLIQVLFWLLVIINLLIAFASDFISLIKII